MFTATKIILAALLILLVGPFDTHGGDGQEKAQSPYLIKTSVLGSAGSPGTSSSFRANGTLGQPTPIGIGSDADHYLYAGFWGAFSDDVTDVPTPDLLQNILFPNFPNPFNPSTTIDYSVGAESTVSITLYNLKGQKIRTLVHESRPPGRYTAIWDGKGDSGRTVASGVYFCRLQIGDFQDVGKMLMLK
ncbi:MAG: FlgD immunoglobulin-like domain containing protein [Candidatus Krumholzibacteria bacterium]|nr:FlgD immunoglobulin-like domain containing protein [Candidatus Krumholzibacteria bacterium]